MQRRAEARSDYAEAGRFRRFSEMVDRPMGILDAVEAVIREPASVEGLSALLSSANERVRERTAWALGYAAAKGVDIAGAASGLIRLLDERDPDLVRGSAYALANMYMNAGALAELDSLRAHRSLHARIGARLAELDRP